MHGDMSEFAHRQERFRAMMIGLALGDATLSRTVRRSSLERPPTSRCANCTR